MTEKQLLWKQYYDAVKSGRRTEAQRVLALIHNSPNNPVRRGGCSKCRKRMG